MKSTKGRKGQSSVKVAFGTPPPRRRDYHWDEVAEQLRANPGEWALVHENLPASVCWARNAGRITPVAPARGFISRTAGNTIDGEGVRWTKELWMCYEVSLDTTIKKGGGAK